MTHPALAAGNVAVITGGASGIGLAAAKRFAAMGLEVCIADRTGLDEARAAIGSEALAIETGVSDRAAVERLAATVAKVMGPVAVLMNNAGVGGGGDALSNPDGWSRVLGVNLFGVLHGVQSFGPAMIAQGAPALIINTGSKQGITQPPGDTAYNVSKSGVRALTEGLAHTLREQGSAVSAHLLIPGFTYTGMTARRLPEKPPAAWTAEQVVEFMLEPAGLPDILCMAQFGAHWFANQVRAASAVCTAIKRASGISARGLAEASSRATSAISIQSLSLPSPRCANALHATMLA